MTKRGIEWAPYSGIDAELERMGAWVQSSGHDYCDLHAPTWDCYTPGIVTIYNGHQIECQWCAVGQTWWVLLDGEARLLKTREDVLEVWRSAQPTSPYDAAITKARQLEHNAPGHFVGPDHPPTPSGGPVPGFGVGEAVGLIEDLREAGLPVPHVAPYPQPDLTGGVWLEWGGGEDGWCVSADWVEGQGWSFGAVRFEGKRGVEHWDAAGLTAAEVVRRLRWIYEVRR